MSYESVYANLSFLLFLRLVRFRGETLRYFRLGERISLHGDWVGTGDETRFDEREESFVKLQEYIGFSEDWKSGRMARRIRFLRRRGGGGEVNDTTNRISKIMECFRG